MGSRHFWIATVKTSMLFQTLRHFVKKGGFILSALSTWNGRKKAPWPASSQSLFSSFLPPGCSCWHSLRVDSFSFHFSGSLLWNSSTICDAVVVLKIARVSLPLPVFSSLPWWMLKQDFQLRKCSWGWMSASDCLEDVPDLSSYFSTFVELKMSSCRRILFVHFPAV